MNEIIQQDTSDAVPVGESATVLSMISRAATDPACDIDKMERLMQMHVDMQNRDAEKQFNIAMVECQRQMPKIAKTERNKQTNSDYESLDALIDQIEPIYTSNGFAPSFNTFPASQEGCDGVICTLMHKGGYSKEYRVEIPKSGLGIKGNRMMTETHGFGSTSTYARRYMLKLIFNISTGDDLDGNAPSQSVSPEQFITLRDKITELGLDERIVLTAHGASSLEQFPAKEFNAAMSRLNQTVKKNA
jgi:hypothetical protein